MREEDVVVDRSTTGASTQEVRPATKWKGCEVCGKPAKPTARGMCRNCYGSWFRAGKPDRVGWAVIRRARLKPRRTRRERKCVVCGRPTRTPALGNGRRVLEGVGAGWEALRPRRVDRAKTRRSEKAAKVRGLFQALQPVGLRDGRPLLPGVAVRRPARP